MKSKKLILIIVCALVLVTAVLAVVHFTTRETVPEGAILVRQDGNDSYITMDKLSLTTVTGTIVNGKGEEREINDQGINLGELAKGDYQTVTVTSDDEFSAEVAVEEIGNAFLILNEDGSTQLVVFGDNNSKRAVRNVTRIEFA